MSCNLETAEVIEGSSPIIPFAKPVSIISPTYIPQREGEWIPKNDSTLSLKLPSNPLTVIRQIKRCLLRQIKTGFTEHLTMV